MAVSILFSAAQAAHCVRATVYRTVYRFEEMGEEGLLDQRKRAKPRKVTEEACQCLLDYLDGSPKDYVWQREMSQV